MYLLSTLKHSHNSNSYLNLHRSNNYLWKVFYRCCKEHLLFTMAQQMQKEAMLADHEKEAKNLRLLL